MSSTSYDVSPSGRPGRPGRGRRGLGLVAVILAAAVAGAAAMAGILAATGEIGKSGGTTTVVRDSSGATVPASSGSASSTGAIDAGAVYRAAAGGVVDITARGGSSSTTTPGPFGQPPQGQSAASGTGFVVDGQGHIVTAEHVVDGASSITVTLQDGTKRKATVLGTDKATDLAVLRVDPSGLSLRPLALGRSDRLGIGAAVAAIGDPFGYDRSISTGIVSGLDRTIQAPNGFTVAHAIQTDAAVNPGNSGGPLLDASGRVIGVLDQIATDGQSDQSSGVGFAVPVDLLRAELSQLIGGSRVAHAYLGVSTGDAQGTTSGALIQSVVPGGPAADAGQRAGDIITNVAGTAIGGSSDVITTIASHRPGDRVAVTARRGSSTVHVTVTLGRQPTSVQSR